MSEVVLDFGPEEMVLNMGPHHPSTHGVLRFVVRTDGEIITEAIPDVGFLHRAIEKIGEKVPYESFTAYSDRIDYVAAMTSNHAWALAVERLADLPVPPRAEALRVITDELGRIASHLIMLGCMAMDVGAVTVFPYALRERETINDLFEELCGARLTFNYQRIGGVSHDAPSGWRDKVLRFLDHVEPVVDQFHDLISYNQIYIARLGGVAAISAAEARSFGLVGPNLRASGVDFDLRRDEPYGAYRDLRFAVPVGKGRMGAVGDCWDRFWVRVEEWRQSVHIVRQALDLMDRTTPGEIHIAPKKLKPKGEAVGRVEAARGEMCIYVVGEGEAFPHRVHIRTGSFTAMSILREKSRGLMVADLVALIASLDVIAPEIDR
jgi:NADH-quinone oxidoreductase subunit D